LAHDQVLLCKAPTLFCTRIMEVSDADTYQQRRLEQYDRADIVELARHNYDGNDWIVEAFDEVWFNGEADILALVLTCPSEGGRVVALQVCQVTDAGQTIWMSALRTHPQHQGRGLANRLKRAAMCASFEHWPSTQRVRYATGDNIEASLRIAKSCGLTATHACNVAVLQPEDLRPLVARIRAAAPTSPVEAAPVNNLDSVKELVSFATLYPRPPDAVVLGYWKIVDACAVSFPTGAVCAQLGVGVIARDDSQPGNRVLNCFLQESLDCEGLLLLIARELETAEALQVKVHVFTPFEFQKQWREFLRVRPGGVVPEVMVLVEGTRSQLLVDGAVP